jgi:HK97 family phage prohead protease
MPWHIESDNPECEGWAVVKDDDGEIEGCHATEEAAEEQLAALNAAEAEAESNGEGDEPAGALEPGDAPAILELETHTSSPRSYGFSAHTKPAIAARGDKSGREERRGSLELREDSGASTAEVFGYASAFDSPYTITDIFGEYEEIVRAGAFDRTIREQDVRLYVNHDGMALARSSAGNLELREDATGLEYRATLDTGVSVVGDLVRLMRAGVMRESSFAFQPIKQKWSADYTKRELLEVKLFDVSVVSLPANPAASAGVRNAELVRWLSEVEPLELAGELRTAGVGEASILEVVGRLASAAGEVREGKVLSAKNATLVREAIDALKALLDAADGPRDARPMMREQALTELLRRRR